MQINRVWRHAGQGVCLVASVAIHTAHAQQEYPTRPIRIIYPFAAGSGNDGMARVFAQRFTAAWGQPAVVDNRAGAGGTIGAELVAKSAPDGHTLLMITASMAVNATLMPRVPVRDLLPVSQINSTGVAVVVHPSLPVTTLKELFALAKTRKEGLNFGSNGTGTTSHLAGAWLQQLSGVRLTHVPYKGEAAMLPAIIGGDVEVATPGTGAIPPLIAVKKLRGIAVTTQRPSRVLPDLPTVASMFPGFDIDNWMGLFVPPGTSAAIIDKLHAEVVKGLQHPDMKPSLQRGDTVGVGSAPTEFAAYFNREVEKFARIIKAAGIKPDA